MESSVTLCVFSTPIDPSFVGVDHLCSLYGLADAEAPGGSHLSLENSLMCVWVQSERRRTARLSDDALSRAAEVTLGRRGGAVPPELLRMARYRDRNVSGVWCNFHAV